MYCVVNTFEVGPNVFLIIYVKRCMTTFINYSQIVHKSAEWETIFDTGCKLGKSKANSIKKQANNLGKAVKVLPSPNACIITRIIVIEGRVVKLWKSFAFINH